MNQAPSPAIPATTPRYVALIPAAGIGARMGAGIPKQYMTLASKPMLQHTLETFSAHPRISHCFVVVSAADGWIDSVVTPALAQRVSVLPVGGATRQETVLNGLNEIAKVVQADDWVLVHDAARPGLDATLIDRLLDTVGNDAVGGLLALPVVDTLKRVDAATDGNAPRSTATVARNGLWAAQTPQMFRHSLLLHALTEAADQGRIGDITDDASAVEMLGLQPRLIEGSPRNLKVTLAHDAALAEFFLKAYP